MMLTEVTIGDFLDLSAVHADASQGDIADMVDIARHHNCICVFALGAHIPKLKEMIGHGAKRPLIGGVVGFPSGGTSTASKVFEANELVDLGVDEIDMVQNITWAKDGAFAQVENEIRAVVQAAIDTPVKVILECHYLTPDQIVNSCKAAADAGAAFVKTGTGWAPTGATLENVALMADAVGGRCHVKAAGGVRTLEVMEKMIDLGVSRFGISAGTARAIIAQIAGRRGGQV